MWMCFSMGFRLVLKFFSMGSLNALCIVLLHLMRVKAVLKTAPQTPIFKWHKQFEMWLFGECFIYSPLPLEKIIPNCLHSTVHVFTIYSSCFRYASQLLGLLGTYNSRQFPTSWINEDTLISAIFKQHKQEVHMLSFIITGHWGTFYFFCMIFLN